MRVVGKGAISSLALSGSIAVPSTQSASGSKLPTPFPRSSGCHHCLKRRNPSPPDIGTTSTPAKAVINSQLFGSDEGGKTYLLLYTELHGQSLEPWAIVAITNDQINRFWMLRSRARRRRLYLPRRGAVITTFLPHASWQSRGAGTLSVDFNRTFRLAWQRSYRTVDRCRPMRAGAGEAVHHRASRAGGAERVHSRPRFRTLHRLSSDPVDRGELTRILPAPMTNPTGKADRLKWRGEILWLGCEFFSTAIRRRLLPISRSSDSV
jgi:hypothetical protein